MQKRIVEERNRATEFLLNFAIGKLCSDTESRCLIPYGLFAFGIRKSSAFKDLFNIFLK